MNAKPYWNNTASHRYAGLLSCGDCSSIFSPRTRRWNDNCRVEYLCKNYIHHGKDFCTSHRIRESELDEKVAQFAVELRHRYIDEQTEFQLLQRLWERSRPKIEREIVKLQEKSDRLEQEIDDILM